MKISTIIKSLDKKKIKFRLIHTGQHYDINMSRVFFDQLGIPEIDINLEAGSGSQASQTAKIMIKYEEIILDNPPFITLVVGDVNSTMACAIVCKKNQIKLGHVEAGIRSGDMSMPEEVNRVVTDSITDYFFTTSQYANSNLRKIGIQEENIYFVGNTMVDTLLQNISLIKKPNFFDNAGLTEKSYFVLTMHRPSNVDNIQNLMSKIDMLNKFCFDFKVIFPVHPRIIKKISHSLKNYSNLIIVEPQPYLEFIYLLKNSKGVITDSGGITEEATMMNIPCITLRENTERPETVILGTNKLVGSNEIKIRDSIQKIITNDWKKASIPEKWDGNSGDRIAEILGGLLWD